MGQPEYLLGMAPEEVDRLTQQHEAWRDLTERLWDLAGIGPGQTVVDLGSGPGLTTLDLARRVGARGRVVGVDTSPPAVAQLRAAASAAGLAARVEAVEADVHGFDLMPCRPDAVTARWLFWVLSEPERLVRRVAGALPPGGVFVVMDYCNYHAVGSAPSSPLFARIFRAVAASCVDSGGSLDVAGALPRTMAAAGLRVEHVEPLQQVGRPGTPVWQWVSNFQRLYFPTLVRKGYITGAELEEFLGWWNDIAQDPDSLFFAPPMLGVVGVRPG
jgi:SAM-dependent methyltransferase